MMKKNLNKEDIESINQLNCLIKELTAYRDIIGIHGNKTMTYKLPEELIHVLQDEEINDKSIYAELSDDVIQSSLSAIRKININLFAYSLKSLANQITEQNEEGETTFTLTLPSLVCEILKGWATSVDLKKYK